LGFSNMLGLLTKKAAQFSDWRLRSYMKTDPNCDMIM
jgi:hypothetical protein